MIEGSWCLITAGSMLMEQTHYQLQPLIVRCVFCGRGHVCLIFNGACKCGFTSKNYQQLQAMYDELGDSQGLRILGFPCNQFGGQVSYHWLSCGHYHYYLIEEHSVGVHNSC